MPLRKERKHVKKKSTIIFINRLEQTQNKMDRNSGINKISGGIYKRVLLIAVVFKRSLAVEILNPDVATHQTPTRKWTFNPKYFIDNLIFNK